MHKPIKCIMMNIPIGIFQIGVISPMSVQVLALGMIRRREVPKFGSYYDSEPSIPTLHTKEKDDIEARLASLGQKLMVHNLIIMTLENAERNEEKIEESKS